MCPSQQTRRELLLRRDLLGTFMRLLKVYLYEFDVFILILLAVFFCHKLLCLSDFYPYAGIYFLI